MTRYFTMGMVLGLSAGLAPGPLLALVISETLRQDVKSGIKIALTPMITDLPIIILACFILAKLSNFHNLLGIFSLAGGAFVFFMGYENIRLKNIELDIQGKPSGALTKGIVTNALSPHPWLFWMSVGGPIMTQAMAVSRIAPVAFISGFYILLVGSKILFAVLVGKSKAFLSGRLYICTLRFLGLALCVLAVALFREGLRLLG